MNNDLTQMIIEHISERISAMGLGKEATCEELFDPDLWNDIPVSERRHVLGRYVSKLVAQRKIPLEPAGFNRARHNLYRKI